MLGGQGAPGVAHTQENHKHEIQSRLKGTVPTGGKYEPPCTPLGAHPPGGLCLCLRRLPRCRPVGALGGKAGKGCTYKEGTRGLHAPEWVVESVVPAQGRGDLSLGDIAVPLWTLSGQETISISAIHKLKKLKCIV